MQHLKCYLYINGTGNVVEAELQSLGSGQIGIRQPEIASPDWVIRGDGSDVNYTITDQTSEHGPYLYGLEWV